MTPKGVEHHNASINADMVQVVKIPMTPKGVEHALAVSKKFHGSGEDSYDAERR